MFWVNPFKTFWKYYSETGVRRDLPLLKRMMVEIPYFPIGCAVAIGSMGGAYIYLNYIFVEGIGFHKHFTVMRSDDPRLKMYRDDVINAEKYADKK